MSFLPIINNCEKTSNEDVRVTLCVAEAQSAWVAREPQQAECAAERRRLASYGTDQHGLQQKTLKEQRHKNTTLKPVVKETVRLWAIMFSTGHQQKVRFGWVRPLRSPTPPMQPPPSARPATQACLHCRTYLAQPPLTPSPSQHSIHHGQAIRQVRNPHRHLPAQGGAPQLEPVSRFPFGLRKGLWRPSIVAEDLT